VRAKDVADIKRLAHTWARDLSELTGFMRPVVGFEEACFQSIKTIMEKNVETV